jgi:nucleotide sugar dehydrogenase
MNISVIGIGKLGLGFALLLEKVGYNVLGVDIFPEYVDKLNNKTISFSEPQYNELLVSSKNFRATTCLEEGVNFSDLIFIIVQTPNSGGEKFYDHSILSNLLERINTYSLSNKDIIIGCTVMPGYIDTIGKNLIKDCKDCYLSYNPEFVAQGEIVSGFSNPDIILVGTESDNLKNKLRELYSLMTTNEPKFCVMKPLDAEIVKISLNGFITTKISYANMISDLCDTLNADKNIVLEAIGSDSRIGNKYFRAGYSFGGPCFPRDTKAVQLLMEKNGINNSLLKATTEYNESHVEFQAKQLLEQDLKEYVFENVCYKENTTIPMIEDSAKLKIAKYIAKLGHKVIIRDNKDTIREVIKEYGNLFTYEEK